MTEPNSTETSLYHPVVEGPGARIGVYKLLQQIGEGGFGIVYMAEQLEPVKRKVALKIIKPGMDTKEVVARFESERQALALMDHPNIAHVLDAGSTETGRPYFVMELVRGVPITEYCDKNNVSTEKRLELFVTVCQAVQHAHQKGVIHRDIKPSNVMVTLHDGHPVPKVIDFGVAKATSQHLTERTLFTAYGQMIGTPAYMSPEQAEMSGLDIDTRSDIYSLGVLLYELLTGSTPFDIKRLRDAGYVEMQRIIREEEPPAPSTRVSTLGAALTIITSHRSTDPGKLRQLLRGDLDLIVMKSLEKERTRRYETASSFAHDIERFLRHEAIQARPPSALYRLRKFAQRNKVAVATGVAIAFCLMLGTVVSTALAIHAVRQRDRAQESLAIADTERHAAEAARRDAEQQRNAAQAASRAEATQRTLADERRRDAEAARQAEAELRDKADQRLADIERKSAEIEALNRQLRGLAEDQRRTIYTANMNLIPRAWETDNVARVLELLEGQRPEPGETDFRGFEWRYWHRRCHDELSAIKIPLVIGQELRTSFAGRTIEFSPDGSRVAALVQSRDGHQGHGVIKMWDCTTGDELLAISLPAPKYPAALPIPPSETTNARPHSPSPYLWGANLLFLGHDRIAIVRREIPTQLQTVTPKHAELVVFDLAKREIMFSLDEATASFFANQNGTRIGAVIIGDDATRRIKLWDGATGELVSTVPLPPGPWQRLAISNNAQRLAIGAWILDTPQFVNNVVDPSIRIIDVSSGETTAEVTDVLPATIEFSPDGSHLAIVTSGPGLASEGASITVRMYDLEEGEELWSKSLEHPLSAIWCKPLFTPRGDWVAFVRHPAVPHETGLFLFDVLEGTPGPTFKGHTPILGAAFDDTGKKVRTAANDGTIKTWTVPPKRSGGQVQIGPWASVRVLDFSPDGTRVATIKNLLRAGSPADNLPQEVVVQDDATNEILWRREIAGKAEQVAFSFDGEYLAASFTSTNEKNTVVAGHVNVWKATSGELVFSVPSLPAMRYAAAMSFEETPIINSGRVAPDFAFSPDSKRIGITTALSDRPKQQWTIRILDVSSGNELVQGESIEGAGIRPLFSGDGRRILTQTTVASPASTTGGATAATNPQANAIKIWDAESGKVLWGLNSVPTQMQFSSDGERLCGCLGSDVVVWEAATGAELLRLPHLTFPRRLGLSPDGKRLVVATALSLNPLERRPAPVTVTDVDAGRQVFQLAGHSAGVTSIAFSPDGTRIVTAAGASAETKVWDSHTGQELLALAGVQSNLRFSADGQRLTGLVQPPSTDSMLTSGEARRIILADISSPQPIVEATYLVETLSAVRPGHPPRTRREIEQTIQDDKLVSAEGRARALELAKTIRRNPLALQDFAWSSVPMAGLSTDFYQRAAELTEEVCAGNPDDFDFLMLRGVALYRLGDWPGAINALTRSLESRATAKRPPAPEEMLFLAMAHSRTGNAPQAQELLANARRLVNGSGSTQVSEWRSILTEAEMLMGLRPANSQPAQPTILPVWGSVIDPLGDCQITAAENLLKVTVPGTMHSLTPANKNFDAPRVCQEVTGDFTAQVKVTCSIEPQDTLTDRTIAFVGAGLLVWQREDDHLRVERNGYFLYRNRPIGSPPPKDAPAPKFSSHAPLVEYIRGGRHATVGRHVWNASLPQLPGPSTWLRLVRRGPTFKISLSHDGLLWQDVPSVDTGLPQTISLGVVARNNSASEFTAEFTDFVVTHP